MKTVLERIFTKGSFALDFNGMPCWETELAAMEPLFAKAAAGIADIEAGKIKNPDEHRKVTHFTDRISYRQSELFERVERFAAAIRDGVVRGSTGKPFTSVVINGIGGSALGPQLMQFAVNGPYWNELSAAKRKHGLKIYFLDNTDASGLADLLQCADPEELLVLTISKSGGTRETRNNMIALENYYKNCKLDFGRHACAITMPNSELDVHAKENHWLACFEMAESIGGRTSETSIVGHLPAVLTGIDFASFLDGACAMDEWTRMADAQANPAMMLAACWYLAGAGKGDRNMVIVPYSDRLVLLSRYLQQLVMESLGKELDLEGNTVHQGLNVFGNKGGTDAHAFIQQLNDGRNDFFATFIEVMGDAENVNMGDGFTIGDYLYGFAEGLALALTGKGRMVIKSRITAVDAFHLGLIIALYERAVAVYAEFININAFHQPGVQAYKLAAKGILKLAGELDEKLAAVAPATGTAEEIAEKCGLSGELSTVSGFLARKAVNHPEGNVVRYAENGKWIYQIR